MGKLGPRRRSKPTTVVKTKHGLSIKVAEKQKLQDCVFLLFFLKQKFLVFFFVFSSFFFLQWGLTNWPWVPTLFFFSFYSLKQKKQQQLFFFFSCLPHIEVRNFIFLFDFFFFSTQHKLLTEFPHQELFFLSFCSIRFPGPGHKANLFLFLGVPIGAPWSYR